MRYKLTDRTTDKNDITYYETTIPKYNEDSNEDVRVVTEIGDRLDIIANQFYGDPSLWWFIARINNLKTMNVPPGIKLRIPNDASGAIVV